MTEKVDFQSKCEHEYGNFLLLNSIVHNQLSDFVDLLEDTGYLKMLVKHDCRLADARLNDCEDFLRNKLRPPFYSLLYDLSNNTFKGIERDITILRLAIENYADNASCTNSRVVAECEITHTISMWYVNSRKQFFRKYLNASGHDYSPYYRSTDISSACTLIIKACDLVEAQIHCKHPVNFSHSEVCTNALNALMNKLNSPDLYEKASKRALELNPTIKIL